MMENRQECRTRKYVHRFAKILIYNNKKNIDAPFATINIKNALFICLILQTIVSSKNYHHKKHPKFSETQSE